jgi:hypothetical protein
VLKVIKLDNIIGFEPLIKVIGVLTHNFPDYVRIFNLAIEYDTLQIFYLHSGNICGMMLIVHLFTVN